jgi:hypothetical protein
MLRVALRIQRVLIAAAPCQGERERDKREGAPGGAGRVRARAIPEAGPQKREGMFARGEKIGRMRVGVAAVLLGVLAAGVGVRGVRQQREHERAAAAADDEGDDGDEDSHDRRGNDDGAVSGADGAAALLPRARREARRRAA